MGISKRVVVNPYNYSKEGLAKLSKTAARVYASGKGLAFPETERAVSQELTKRGIVFTHQHIIDVGDSAYVVDFMFPGPRLIIELDRTGRHNRELREYDAKRDRRLRRRGFRVIRVRDNGRPDYVVSAVLTALLKGSKGRSAL
jgi:very-short-patch-repair endonuclease